MNGVTWLLSRNSLPRLFSTTDGKESNLSVWPVGAVSNTTTEKFIDFTNLHTQHSNNIQTTTTATVTTTTIMTTTLLIAQSVTINVINIITQLTNVSHIFTFNNNFTQTNITAVTIHNISAMYSWTLCGHILEHCHTQIFISCQSV